MAISVVASCCCARMKREAVATAIDGQSDEQAQQPQPCERAETIEPLGREVKDHLLQNAVSKLSRYASVGRKTRCPWVTSQ